MNQGFARAFFVHINKGAKHQNTLAILHSLCLQSTFKASELLDGDGSPDPDVHKKELEGKIDDALHGW